MCIVNHRNERSLLQIISKICLPQTIVWTDKWPGYLNLQDKTGFQHGTVDHCLHFVDPETIYIHRQ